jgi:hypothetical protein
MSENGNSSERPAPAGPESSPRCPAPAAAPKVPAASRWAAVVGHPAFGFALVGLVFVILRIAAVSGREPKLFPDSATYRVPPQGSPYEVLDLAGHAPRAWVLPLFYRILPNDAVRIGAQVVLSLAAWLGLGGVLVSALRSRLMRRAAFLAVLLLAATPQVTTWDLAVLSESLMLSLAVGAAAAWVRMASRPSAPAGTAAVLLTGLWVLIRPLQFPLALLTVAVCLFWALRPERRILKLAMASALMIAAVWSLVMSPHINEAYRQRDGYGVSYFAEVFGQNAFKRYLADPEAKAWFRARGMPDDAGMSSPSKYPGSRVDDYGAWNVFFAELRARPDWMRWLDKDARTAFLSYVRAHPAKVLSDFVDEVPIMLRAASHPVYGEPVKMLGPFSRVFFWGSSYSLVRGDWGLLAVICAVLGLAAAMGRVRPSWPLLTTGIVVLTVSGALLFQVWLGSAYEKIRHAVPGAYLLRVGLIVIVVVLLDALIAPRTRTSPEIAS